MLSVSEIVAYVNSPVDVPSIDEGRYFKTVINLAQHADSLGTLNNTHIARTAELAKALANKLGIPPVEQEAYTLAGLLHDVGKAFIPENILTKPGKLSKYEWEVMRYHPELGVKILKPISRLSSILPFVQSHHERVDGNGYPNRLGRNEIPFGARIIAIVDAFSTMMSGRVYQPEKTFVEAVAEIKRCSGTHFDAEMVDEFVELLQEGNFY